jgi:uncharacterized protein
MGVTTALALVTVGLIVGTISGMLGIGGALMVIPVLMFGFHFTQVKANGTSLAMLLPPIGIFAVIQYWRAGNVESCYAVWMAIGFAVGAYLGAVLVNAGKVNQVALRFMFAALLLYVAGRLLLATGGKVWEAMVSTATAVGFLWFFSRRASKSRRSVGVQSTDGLQSGPGRLLDQHDYEI